MGNIMSGLVGQPYMRRWRAVGNVADISYVLNLENSSIFCKLVPHFANCPTRWSAACKITTMQQHATALCEWTLYYLQTFKLPLHYYKPTTQLPFPG